MKRILSFFLMLMLVLVFIACSASQENEGQTDEPSPILTDSQDDSAIKKSGTTSIMDETNISENLRQVLESMEQPELTPEMVALFYDYYSDYYNTYTADFVTHNKELRLLPSFKENSPPSWDELTHFIFYFAKEDSRGQYGEKLIKKFSFVRQ